MARRVGEPDEVYHVTMKLEELFRDEEHLARVSEDVPLLILNNLPGNRAVAEARTVVAGCTGLVNHNNVLVKAARLKAERLLVDVVPGAETDDQRVLRYMTDLEPPYDREIEERWTPGGRLVIKNRLRDMRPRRAVDEPVTTINPPFDPKCNYQKWKGETLAVVQVGMVKVWLLLNKFGYMSYSLVAVPEIDKPHPQIPDLAFLELMQELWERVEKTFPGVVLLFNAVGARSSVMHLHCHVLPKAYGLSMEQGVGAAGIHYIDLPNAPAAWPFIREIHRTDTETYSLAVGRRTGLLPRKYQGAVKEPVWTTGIASAEAIAIMLAIRQYGTLSDAAINRTLREVVTGKVLTAAYIYVP
jgi:hypothetical protein